MTLSERVQHLLLLISFIVLVTTGFALKYPHSFGAEPIVAWEKGFPMRGLVHRIARVVLIGASIYHLIYLMATRDGRSWIQAMIPKVRDVREAVQTVCYNLGYRPSLPHYARFNYMEKAEYWALVWGTVVMAATGIVLWAHNFVLKYFSNSVIDIATAIHYYEAILVTLAIVIWHFYAVIFDPDVYPLKWTFVSGRAPAHEGRREAEETPATPAPHTKPGDKPQSTQLHAASPADGGALVAADTPPGDSRVN